MGASPVKRTTVGSKDQLQTVPAAMALILLVFHASIARSNMLLNGMQLLVNSDNTVKELQLPQPAASLPGVNVPAVVQLVSVNTHLVFASLRSVVLWLHYIGPQGLQASQGLLHEQI